MSTIVWDVNPEAISFGSITIRYYGLLFASGFFFGHLLMKKLVEKEGYNSLFVDIVLWYMMVATVIGARLGHCLFYEPEYYLAHPFEILKVWQGGLASHGAAIGIVTGMILFGRKYSEYGFWYIMDRVVISVSLAAIFIRTGNLMNSEIIGRPTDGSWGFIFAKVDQVPRHPAQIYEAIAYFITLLVLLFLWNKESVRSRRGVLTGVCFALIFGTRFFIEFLKEVQVEFEKGLPLDLGQLLSIPMALGGAAVAYWAWKKAPSPWPKAKKL